MLDIYSNEWTREQVAAAQHAEFIDAGLQRAVLPKPSETIDHIWDMLVLAARASRYGDDT